VACERAARARQCCADRRAASGGRLDARTRADANRYGRCILCRGSHRKETSMPRGDKSSYSGKQKRRAEHIEEGYEKRGVGSKEAARRAWATVNKESGGGKKKGSGRGKKENRSASRKGGHKGGRSRSHAASA